MKKLILALLLIPSIAFAQNGLPTSAADGQLGRNDGVPFQYDLANTTWAHLDSDRYENVVFHGAVCDGTTDNTAAIQAAITAASTSGKGVFFPSCVPGNTYLTNSVSLGDVYIAEGGVIEVNTANTLDIGGKILANPKSLIFTGSGNVSINTEDTVYPQWWGAVGDGDDANAVTNVAAIQAAIDSIGNGTVVFSGEFRVGLAAPGSADMIAIKSGVTLSGVSQTEAIIKVADAAGQYRAIIAGDDTVVDQAVIENLTFDHNATNNTFATEGEYTGTGRYTVYFVGGTNNTLRNNVVRDTDSVVQFYAPSTVANEVSNLTIIGNKFIDIGNNAGDYQYDHSTINATGINSIISGNQFYGVDWNDNSAKTAIESHLSNSIISNNQIDQYYVGILLAGVNLNRDVEDVIIDSNSILVRREGIQLWSQQSGTHTTGFGLNGVVVSNNSIRIEFTRYTDVAAVFGGIRVFTTISLPINDLSIVGNKVSYEIEQAPVASILSATTGIGVDVSSDIAVSNVLIADNIVQDAPQTGIKTEGAILNNLIIRDNLIVNPGRTLATVSALERVGINLQADSFEDVVIVQDNTIVDNQATSTLINGIYTDTTNAGDGLVKLLDNNIELSGADQSSFTRQYNIGASNNVLPFIDATHVGFVQPIRNSLNGSQVFDSSTNTTYWLKSTGASWEATVDMGLWKTWVPTYGASGSMTYTSVSTTYARYRDDGDKIEFEIRASGTTGGAASNYLTFTLPVSPANPSTPFYGFVIDGSSAATFTFWDAGNTFVRVNRYDNSNYGLGAGRILQISGSYEK